MIKGKLFYFVLTGITFFSFIGSFLVPEIGRFSLWNEVLVAVGLLAVTVMLVKLIFSIVKLEKTLNLILIIIVVVLIGGVTVSKSVNIVKDVISGPEWVTISNCTVEKRGTMRGFGSLNYYLNGEDSDFESYRFSISGSEYDSLAGVKDIKVFCYKNTARIVEIKKVSGAYE